MKQVAVCVDATVEDIHVLAYHPQQSVLKPHAGQRHTACIRNISTPQRSHRTLSSQLAGRATGGVG
jgi:hypothetical protein